MGRHDLLPEPARNRLLRRVDWRFLLPNPHPKVSICFGNEQLAQALALVSGQVIDHHRGRTATSCDLAVTVNPDAATLRQASAALLPGGMCYSEWYSPAARGVSGVRRQLRAAGFADVTCYWAWPWPSLGKTRFWIPLEAPGALSHFMATRPPVPNRLRRFARAFGRKLLTLATLRIVPFPVCAVSRKPLAAEADPRAASPGSPAARYFPELGLAPRQQSVLLLTGGTRTIHKVVGLVFREPDPQPRAVVKWPRVPEAIRLLEMETAALTAVQALRPDGVAGVPKVLFCEHTDGGLVLGETALGGAPLYTQLHRGNARALTLSAVNWLVNLAGEQPPEPPPAVWGSLVEPILAEFESTFGPALEPGLIRQTRSILQTLAGCPVVYEHRDFSPWNVLVGPTGEFAVLDWEGAEPRGLPLLDLVYFIAHLGFFLDGAYRSRRFRDSYRASLNPATHTGSIRAEALGHYQRRLHLDPAVMAPLRIFVWLVHARSEYQRMVADATGPIDPERLRRAAFVGLWEEELSLLKVTA